MSRKREGELRKQIGEGFEAKRILENPLVVEYFENARGGIMQRLQTADVDEEKERELVRMLKVLAHFERDFQKIIKSGNKAENLLAQLFKR